MSLEFTWQNGKRCTIERLMNNRKNAVTSDFTSHYLGFSHLSEEKMHKERTDIFYSSCNNVHKQRSLIKHMVCVVPNKSIAYIMGPFKATKCNQLWISNLKCTLDFTVVTCFSLTKGVVML